MRREQTLTRRQSGQHLGGGVLDDLGSGDPQALVEQQLVSAQNHVVAERAGYTNALTYRAQWIALAHAVGWSKYRIAQRLGITRRAVDEALARPPLSPTDFMAAEVARNGGHEDLPTRRLRELLIEQESVSADPQSMWCPAGGR